MKTKRIKSAKELIKEDAKKQMLKKQKREESKKYSALLKENDELKKFVSFYDESQNFVPKLIDFAVEDKNTHSEATAVVLASDWHIEQRVDPRRLTYTNVYNLEIAEARSKQFFQNVVKLIKKEQESTKIENLVLWLGGDFISSNIHEALVAICLLGPAQAIIMAEEILIGGIQYILDNTSLKITCPTSCGNHSRITKKIWISTEEDNSLETIIYHNIKKHFEKEERFELIMPLGPVTIIDVYGKSIAFGHGHHGVKYSGGVGGIDVPLRRHILRKYSQRNIYMYCLGHFHQYKQDTNFAVNGSMIGWDDYSESMGFEYDKPRQTFFLIDKKRDSRTVTTPIMFDR